jgi:hypothetical protein
MHMLNVKPTIAAVHNHSNFAVESYKIHDEFEELRAAIRILGVIMDDCSRDSTKLAGWQMEHVEHLADSFYSRLGVTS